jgi:alkylated DNA repair dioxygenase AlkB
MSVSVQESLLDLGSEPVLGPLGSAVRRTRLAHGARVDVRPGWLAGSGTVFSRLVETVPWRAEKRHMYDRVVDVPRLLCFYGEDAPLPDPVLVAARRALNSHYGAELGEEFRTAGLCLYRDGRDSVAWHGDTIGRGAREDTMVAILSLGTPPGADVAAARRRGFAAVRARARRPAGHGRQLPAHLGARDTEGIPGRRGANQRAVPAARGALRFTGPLARRGVRD